MAQSIKVPKEVLDVFYESIAASSLAAAYDESFFPSLKALYYGQKAAKARTLAWRALGAAHPQTLNGPWRLDMTAGTVTKEEVEAEAKPKKPRKPRTIKPAATVAPTEGESK